MPKFPGKPAIVSDGNAFAVLAAVRKAMKQNGATKEDIDEYMAVATAGDYDNLLIVSSEYVDIETPDMHENPINEFEDEDEDDPFAPEDSDDFGWDEDDEDFEDEEYDDAAAW